MMCVKDSGVCCSSWEVLKEVRAVVVAEGGAGCFRIGRTGVTGSSGVAALATSFGNLGQSDIKVG